MLQTVGMWAAFTLVWVLCVAGIALSCFSLSGTWLVTMAALITALLRDAPFPGVMTVVAFAVISGAIEVMEMAAGMWGVERRSGSRIAGIAAFVGGVLGLLVGTMIPVPVVGSLLGMFVGSFALSFAAEYWHSSMAAHAMHVAIGAVLARVAVVFVKVVATLGMIGVLGFGVLVSG